MSSLIGPFRRIVTNDGLIVREVIDPFPTRATRATRRPVREVTLASGRTYRMSDVLVPVVTHCRVCGEALYDDEIAREAQTCGEAECEEAG